MRPDDVLIVNPMAPTFAWVRTDLDGKKRKFKSWYEFKSWFDPKHHGEFVLPPKTTETFIDVLVDTLTDSPRNRRIAAAKERIAGKKEKAAKSGGTSGSVSVTVAGVRYGTLMTAFKKLGLPMSDRKKVRKEVLAQGETVYGGYKFKLAE